MINLFIVDIFISQNDNGVKTYIKELLKGIKESKDNINVSLIRINFSALEYSKKKGEITEYEIPIPFVKQNVFNNDDLPNKYYNKVIDIIQKDIKGLENVIFHFNWIGHDIFSNLIKQRINCKTLLTRHCVPWKTLMYSDLKKFIELQKFIDGPYKNRTIPPHLIPEKEDYNNYDKIISVTEISKEGLIKTFKISENKIVTIYNGIGVKNEVMLSRNKLIQLRVKYGLGKNDKILLFVGREEKLNGFLMFLHHLMPLLIHDRKIKVIVAGKLNAQRIIAICNNIWSSIIYTGHISFSNLSDLYSLSDIGIIPSLYEQCSYVALEMMQHNLPIIATKVGGLKEIIKDGHNGILIPIKYKDNKFDVNGKNLQKSVTSLLENQKLRKAIIENAKINLIDNHSLDKMSRKTINIYNSLL